MKKLIFFIIFLFLYSNAWSLDLTVYVPIHEPLSKTITSPIVGSSNFVIDKKEIQNNNNNIHEILDKRNGIKSRSI